MSDPAADDQPHEIIDADLAPATRSEQEQNQAAADFEKHHDKAGESSMEVKVHSPFKSYYDGQAFSISGVNATGPFDILPRHHNFITLLDACELVVRSTHGDEKIQIGGGIMHVKADKVIVFLDV
ncbi:MAG: atpC [Candidatus Saccharibacteria bacterium]|nr:atpC [Candidatus Saccharibacteria bacterium]